VLEKTASQKNGGLPLSVLDTTDPATILQLEKSLPLEKTLFIVASKSGTTAEPLAFADYFYAKLQDKLGKWAGDNFVAITDPNTPLVEMAKQRSYRRIFYNFADIGGRYSALSYFGLLPSALTGLDVAELLERALRMEHACASFVAASKNPGISLGAALGLLAKRGLNKVTFLTPQSIAPFGMWLEQLLAESTGKEGTGLLPVAGEPLGSPAVYGDDRVFVYLRLAEEVDQKLEKGTQALRDAGHPLITIRMDDHLDLGQEFFRWEIATATAGALLGINAFDQPNVQESKDNTNHLLDVETRKGGLPELDPLLVEGPLRLYFPETASTAAETLSRFLSRAQPGNYFALLAYLTESPYSEKSLQNIRLQVRDRFKLATTVGYGPRFLHSTGQFHKGGPNTGLFLQITADNKEDAPIPGAAYTFGELKQAQAAGDFQALQKHKRQVGRIHLSGGIDQGLEALQSAMRKALGH